MYIFAATVNTILFLSFFLFFCDSSKHTANEDARGRTNAYAIIDSRHARKIITNTTNFSHNASSRPACRQVCVCVCVGRIETAAAARATFSLRTIRAKPRTRELFHDDNSTIVCDHEAPCYYVVLDVEIYSVFNRIRRLSAHNDATGSYTTCIRCSRDIFTSNTILQAYRYVHTSCFCDRTSISTWYGRWAMIVYSPCNIFIEIETVRNKKNCRKGHSVYVRDEYSANGVSH